MSKTPSHLIPLSSFKKQFQGRKKNENLKNINFEEKTMKSTFFYYIAKTVHLHCLASHCTRENFTIALHLPQQK